ncbi:putative SWEET sugar transporter [Helianthus annuus]|nr:putative SWEET sugar transporter [Helianthus annuus]KAJ0769401.1 putative SWEET sugar transporter [Helianthus annuus]KAJ0802616.1 putative SWEET sugar transporter [Helianthus annuus]
MFIGFNKPSLICDLMNMMQKLVITTKSVEYMPFLLSLFCLCNGLCWFVYALFPFDPFIAVSNHFFRVHHVHMIYYV